MLLGLNASSGTPVFWDRFGQDNYNSVTLARSGAGKSYLTKLELLRLLCRGTHAAVIDPEDEYLPLAQSVGGTVVRLGAAGVRLNPFDMPPAGEPGTDQLVRRVLFLHTFLSVLLRTDFDPAQRAALDRALLATYRRAGITGDPGTWALPSPTLELLHVVLAEEGSAVAAGLADRLAPYVSGSHAGLFNGPTTTRPEGHLVVFALRPLPQETRAPAMLLALDAVWRRITAPARARRQLVVVDEAWLLMREAEGARFLMRMAKSGRKHWCGLAVVSQDADDVLASPLGRAVVANAATQLLLRQAPQAVEEITETFALSRGERDFVLTARRGEALLLAGHRHKAALVALASPAEHALITTDRKNSPHGRPRRPQRHDVPEAGTRAAGVLSHRPRLMVGRCPHRGGRPPVRVRPRSGSRRRGDDGRLRDGKTAAPRAPQGELRGGRPLRDRSRPAPRAGTRRRGAVGTALRTAAPLVAAPGRRSATPRLRIRLDQRGDDDPPVDSQPRAPRPGAQSRPGRLARCAHHRHRPAPALPRVRRGDGREAAPGPQRRRATAHRAPGRSAARPPPRRLRAARRRNRARPGPRPPGHRPAPATRQKSRPTPEVRAAAGRSAALTRRAGRPPAPSRHRDPRRRRIRHGRPRGLRQARRPPWQVALTYATSTPQSNEAAETVRGRAHALASAFGLYSARNWLVRLRFPPPYRQLTLRSFPRRADLLSVPELAALAHLPFDPDAPGLARAAARSVLPPPAVPTPTPGSGVKPLGRCDIGTRRPVGLHAADARQHLHLMGATGSGKSTLIANLALDDARHRRGLVVVDPKGDLVTDLLDRLPAECGERLVLIDPDDPHPPPCLNVLEGADIDVVVDNIAGIFRRIFHAFWGPRTDDLMRAACLTLLRHHARTGQLVTLADVPRLLAEPAFRLRLIPGLKDPVLKGFWTWYETLSEPAQAAVNGPVMNKLRAFLLRDFARRAIAQGHSTFDLADTLDGGILLARLPKGALGEETARLLGSFIVAKVWQAAAARARHEEDGRIDASLYIDECHNFLTLPYPLEDMLAEARGYRLSLNLAHQHLAQLPTDLREGISANARNKIFFTASPEDARALERHTAPLLTAHDLAHLGRYQATARLLVDGTGTQAFTLTTRPLPPVIPGRAHLLRAHAARRAGTRPTTRTPLPPPSRP